MNFIKVLPFGFILAFLIIISSNSCHKTGYTYTASAADSATQIIIANDELNVNYEFDQLVNQALLATTVCYTASGANSPSTVVMPLYNTIPNGYIDTTKIIDSALITVAIAGKNADQTKGIAAIFTLRFARDNNGKIIPWKTPGATITLTIDSDEVTTLVGATTAISIKGSATITNVSGGLLNYPAYINLPTGDSLQDKVNGNVVFTYNDNAAIIVTYAWAINQLRTFTMQNSMLTSTIRGDTVVNAVSDISTSGVSRFNDNFYTSVTSPVVQTINASFLLTSPISGQKAMYGIKEPMNIFYGVDTGGNAVSSNAYGYKISWVDSSAHSRKSIIKYPAY